MNAVLDTSVDSDGAGERRDGELVAVDTSTKLRLLFNESSRLAFLISTWFSSRRRRSSSWVIPANLNPARRSLAPPRPDMEQSRIPSPAAKNSKKD